MFFRTFSESELSKIVTFPFLLPVLNTQAVHKSNMRLEFDFNQLETDRLILGSGQMRSNAAKCQGLLLMNCSIGVFHSDAKGYRIANSELQRT